MSWLGALFSIIQSILDRMPSRKEALKNEIQEVHDAIKKLQQKSGTPWTVNDSAKYAVLANRLSALEKRLNAIG